MHPPTSTNSRKTNDLSLITQPPNLCCSQLFSSCLEALRLCENFDSDVFEKERIRLKAWARDTGVQEGMLDKVITTEDGVRLALYTSFANICLVSNSVLELYGLYSKLFKLNQHSLIEGDQILGCGPLYTIKLKIARFRCQGTSYGLRHVFGV